MWNDRAQNNSKTCGSTAKKIRRKLNIQESSASCVACWEGGGLALPNSGWFAGKEFQAGISIAYAETWTGIAQILAAI